MSAKPNYKYVRSGSYRLNSKTHAVVEEDAFWISEDSWKLTLQRRYRILCGTVTMWCLHFTCGPVTCKHCLKKLEGGIK